jgi:hypothetical protein
MLETRYDYLVIETTKGQIMNRHLAHTLIAPMLALGLALLAWFGGVAVILGTATPDHQVTLIGYVVGCPTMLAAVPLIAWAMTRNR